MFATTWQPTLTGSEPVSFDTAFASLRRLPLDELCWLDHEESWLAGADDLFAELVQTLPWRTRQVVMWGRLVDEPRLSCWWDGSGSPWSAVLERARLTLSERYERVFDSVGANFYRDGSDSVAWHADRVRHMAGRDAVIAIVSLGARRPFLVRPAAGPHRRSRCFHLGGGDLFVMGGACQDRFEHTVPKVARSGPRLSLTFRHGDPGAGPGLADRPRRRRYG